MADAGSMRAPCHGRLVTAALSLVTAARDKGAAGKPYKQAMNSARIDLEWQMWRQTAPFTIYATWEIAEAAAAAVVAAAMAAVDAARSEREKSKVPREKSKVQKREKSKVPRDSALRASSTGSSGRASAKKVQSKTRATHACLGGGTAVHSPGRGS